MSNPAPLERLCDHYHIATSYQDSAGVQHTLPPEILRALLASIGVKTAHAEEEERALNDAEIATWCRPLPPVLVVLEDERSFDVTLCVRITELNQRFLWTLHQEDGNQKSGEYLPADLKLVGEKNVEGEQWQQRCLTMTAVPAPGYHRLELHTVDNNSHGTTYASMPLIIAPATCYWPQVIVKGQRIWGPSLQLYAVRSARNWGIGDFTDLRHVVEFSAQAGAGLVGVNPLHALFPDEPARATPYKPSNRWFLNILYLDVESISDFAESADAQQQVADAAFQARLRALRSTELVDYAGVAEAKMEVLETLYHHFRDHHLKSGSQRARAFDAFRKEQGKPLQYHATYEALRLWWHERRRTSDHGTPLPKSCLRPESHAVDDFSIRHEEQITFFAYLQWQAFLQLNAVGRRAYELGLGVGLYQNLTLSADAHGSEFWSGQKLFASCHIGAPPDETNPEGQDWGVAPISPEALREQAYEPFIALLRQNMQVAGALRIDHIVSLMRLFWIPPGHPPADGTYVYYPFQDLLSILALESQRNSCLVIGDDLGMVPDELRQLLHSRGVLSYRLLFFEKVLDGSFKTISEYELQALVAITTHDLPTLAGYWQGRDLELRGQLGLFHSPEQREQQLIARAEERTRLLMALEEGGLVSAEQTIHQIATPEMTQELAEAIHRYLAKTPAQLMAVQMEDVFGGLEQINLPGSNDQYPNWSRKLPLELELWGDEPRVNRIFKALLEERGNAVIPPQETAAPGAVQREVEIPTSTYRLQFHHGFTFDDAAHITSYLHRLGCSHCYISPCLQARPGSSHGYDIIDHTRLNEELNGEAGFIRFSDALKQNKMELILDVVPNHMGIMGSDNGWWLDVLENGPSSLYAEFFDIDWIPLKDELRAKVLIPVLGDHYGKVLDRRELELRFNNEKGAFSVHYYEHEFPIDPREYPFVLTHDIARLERRLGSEDQRLLEFQSLITAFGNLPTRSKRGEADIAERNRDKELHKANLSRQCRDADIAQYLAENMAFFNGSSGVELLHELLDRQAWRLAYWQVASDEINYRRFSDINELAGLRMENDKVFETTHKLILGMIEGGQVKGVRIDHPDGLFDPAGYFRRLQGQMVVTQPLMVSEQRGNPDGNHPARPLYLLVEKILAPHERLHESWAVHGTTGYDFANQANGLFIDAAAETRFERIYRNFIGDELRLDEQIYAGKKLILHVAMASELNVLARQLSQISELDRHTRDFTLNSLRDALSEVIALFPVYRTYVSSETVTEDDRHYVEWAIKLAKKRSTANDVTIFDFVREVLLTDIGEGKSEEYKHQVNAFAMKFQQYTGPVMAKGVEDTAFYRYNRLVSLNEVGGDPGRFGLSVNAFHHQNLERAKSWPHTMLNTSTHDSKRSEDVRTRLDVLSELPDEWDRRVRGWARMNRKKKTLIADQWAPSRNDEYLLYQTLLGAWPLDMTGETALGNLRERIQTYMLKAIKEAKVHTSWINPNSEYEQAMHGFIETLLSGLDNNRFLTDFLPFQHALSRAGLFNSLSQTLLKLTSPGVPDIYQGCELWNFSLVDPDNRRPVDYAVRDAMLTQLQEAQASSIPVTALLGELMNSLHDGRAKLYLTWRTLQLRQSEPELFRDGDYQPLQVNGVHADHLCAFARRLGEQVAVVVVPRLIYRLAGNAAPLGEEIWGATTVELPGSRFHNWLTDESLDADDIEGNGCTPAGKLLHHFPVALLVSHNPGANLQS